MLIQKELEIVVEGKGLYNITDIINQAISCLLYTSDAADE